MMWSNAGRFKTVKRKTEDTDSDSGPRNVSHSDSSDANGYLGSGNEGSDESDGSDDSDAGNAVLSEDDSCAKTILCTLDITRRSANLAVACAPEAGNDEITFSDSRSGETVKSSGAQRDLNAVSKSLFANTKTYLQTPLHNIFENIPPQHI